jgi:hypothetical protein
VQELRRLRVFKALIGQQRPEALGMLHAVCRGLANLFPAPFDVPRCIGHEFLDY